MRMSDWSSDVCSSDLKQPTLKLGSTSAPIYPRATSKSAASCDCSGVGAVVCDSQSTRVAVSHTASGKISSCLLSIESEWGQNGGGNLALLLVSLIGWRLLCMCKSECSRSEEHTSELQSLMRISYAVFCLKKKKHRTHKISILT